jgi:hypothetical protein
MYRKSFFDRIELRFPEINEYNWFGVDTLLMPYLFYTASNIKLLAKHVYLYNYHPGSDSYNSFSSGNSAHINFIENFWVNKIEYLHRNGEFNTYQKELLEMLCSIYRNSKFSDRK